MVEIEIPKDIRKYDSKLIGPFTTRQTICVIIAGVVAVAAYRCLDSFSGDLRLMISGLLAAPALLFGWYKPFGMKMEDFLRTAFVSTVLSPKKRKYKTQNIYATSLQNSENASANKRTSKKKNTSKKSSTYVAYD